LLLVSLSVPIIHDIYFLKVNLSSGDLVLGNWGVCVQKVGAAMTCSPRTQGYNIQTYLDSLIGNTETFKDDIIHGLTYAFVLHPIAAALAFVAFMLAVCSNIVSHIFGSIVAFFATLITLVALGIDLGLFISARNRINDQATGSPASLSNAIWMVLGALISLLIASFTICCGGMRDRRSRQASSSYDPNAYFEKRTPFWRRRRTAIV